MDNTDLIAKLRDDAASRVIWTPTFGMLATAAADALEVAQAEIGKLMDQAAHWKMVCATADGKRDSALTALRTIARGAQMDHPHKFTAAQVAEIAKEAIKSIVEKK